MRCGVLALLALTAAAQPSAPRLAATLSERLLRSTSATQTLQEWCAEHRLAERPVMTAKPVRGARLEPTPAQRQRLQVAAGTAIRYRRVQLVCGDRVLSEAHNWYVPGRLPEETNRLLETTDTPFGKAIAALAPSRKTLVTQRFWNVNPVPAILFEHHALVLRRDGVPIAEVHESYQRAVLP